MKLAWNWLLGFNIKVKKVKQWFHLTRNTCTWCKWVKCYPHNVILALKCMRNARTQIAFQVCVRMKNRFWSRLPQRRWFSRNHFMWINLTHVYVVFRYNYGTMYNNFLHLIHAFETQQLPKNDVFPNARISDFSPTKDRYWNWTFSLLKGHLRFDTRI